MEVADLDRLTEEQKRGLVEVNRLISELTVKMNEYLQTKNSSVYVSTISFVERPERDLGSEMGKPENWACMCTSDHPGPDGWYCRYIGPMT